MGIIIQLSKHVANQIAAGEVIERPLSVIKELLENSLDAKAKHIEVRIKNAGFTHIIVQDDGIGMDEEDLSLCLNRYATSKLSSVSDLYRLSTFGFRGEAISSIAAVSRINIISRKSDQDFGVKLVAESGEIKEITKSSASIGTRFLVKDLFFNVPARLKFISSKNVENLQIEKLIKSFAFIEEDVSFSLYKDDKLIFSSYKNNSNSLIDKGHALLGKDYYGHLYDFNSATEAVKINGVIADPTVSRRDSRGIIIFVNKRLIIDKKIMFAIKTAFNNILQVGYQPVSVLNLTVAPDEIDINIHPRKMEIKFKNEQIIIRDLISSLSDFLKKTPWLKTSQSYVNEYNHVTYQPFILKNNDNIPNSPLVSAQIKLLPANNFSELKIVGQLSSTYIVLENNDAMIIIDQHAAHERIMFEKIKTYQSHTVTYPLLIPINVSLNSMEMAILKNHDSHLRELGLEIEIFGENQIIIRQVPQYLIKADMNLFLKDMIFDIEINAVFTSHKLFFDKICATLACHASIRAGQNLNNQEIEKLLLELDHTDFAAHCPHGRPIVKSILKSEVKKWFDRT